MILTSFKMTSQSSANFTIFRAHARHRGRTAIPFIEKYIFTAAKKIGADLFKTAAPEIGEFIVDEKLKTFAKDVGTKTVRKQLGGRKKSKRRTRRAISRKISSKTSRSRKDIFDKKIEYKSK